MNKLTFTISLSIVLIVSSVIYLNSYAPFDKTVQNTEVYTGPKITIINVNGKQFFSNSIDGKTYPVPVSTDEYKIENLMVGDGFAVWTSKKYDTKADTTTVQYRTGKVLSYDLWSFDFENNKYQLLIDNFDNTSYESDDGSENGNTPRVAVSGKKIVFVSLGKKMYYIDYSTKKVVMEDVNNITPDTLTIWPGVIVDSYTNIAFANNLIVFSASNSYAGGYLVAYNVNTHIFETIYDHKGWRVQNLRYDTAARRLRWTESAEWRGYHEKSMRL